MKCPDCNFVCSNLRDLCPKCYVDLREFKNELGIPVTNPRSTYEQLLERAGVTRTKLPDEVLAPTTKKSVWNSLLRVFGSKPLDTTLGAGIEDSTEKRSAGKNDGKRAHGQEANSTFEPEPTHVPSSNNPTPAAREELASVVQDDAASAVVPSQNLLAPPLSATGSMLGNEGPGFSFNIEIPPLAPEQQNQFPPFHSQEIPEPPSFNDGIRAALESRLVAEVLEAASEEMRKEEDLSLQPPAPEEIPPVAVPPQEPAGVVAAFEPPPIEFPNTSPPSESCDHTAFLSGVLSGIPSEDSAAMEQSNETDSIPARAEPENVAPPAAPKYELKPANHTLGPELDALFAEALGDPFTASSDNAIELSSEHFYANVQPEKVAVLFEMTREALLDPESERRYSDEIETSSRRKVESEEMTAQLRNVVQVMNAPMVTLKGRQGLGLSGKSIEPEAPSHWEPSHISSSRRLAAFLVDALVLIFLTLLSTSALLVAIMPDFDAVLLGERIPNIFDIINVVSYSALNGMLLSVILPTLSLSFWSSTPGLSAMGLLALSLRGKSVGKAQALVRSVVLPLSLLFFGWIPVLFGKRSLHDAAARTVVARKRDRRAA